MFRGSPYFENWTDELLMEEYNFLNEKGVMYGKYIDDNIVGMVSYLPYKVDEHNIVLPENKKIGYLADIAVLNEYRKRGIGTEMFTYVVNKLISEKYDYLYFRTVINGSMSEGIGKKLGFEIVYDDSGNLVTQEISFPRNRPDIPEKESRKFLLKKI